MSTVSAGACASPWPSGPTDAAQPTPTVASASLMPDPDVTVLAGGDALSLMYFFEAKDQSLSVDGGTARIQGLQAERNRSFVQERQAIAKEDNAAKSGGFWGDMGHILGDVAKVAGIVAAVAVTVCTAGTAAPVAALAIAGILLSSASFVDGEFHVLQKLGVDPKAAGWVDTGMAVVGAVCSFGAGAASAGGAAAGAASAIGRGASVASGVASMAQGASTIEVGQAQSASDEASADQVQAQVQSADALRFMQVVITETETSDDAAKQIMATITVTKGIQNDTAVQAATAVRG
jgi:hypothetical protein